MNNEIIDILLNGLSLPFFLAMYISALVGVLVFFIREVLQGLKYDNRTSTKFNWKTMWQMSALRILVGMIGIAVSIVYFPEMSKILFQVEQPLEINGALAFIMGMSIDRVVDGLLGIGKDSSTYVINKLKK